MSMASHRHSCSSGEAAYLVHHYGDAGVLPVSRVAIALRHCEGELEGLCRRVRDVASGRLIQGGSRRSVGASRDCSEVHVIWQGGVHPEVDQGSSTPTPMIGHGQVDYSGISPVEVHTANGFPRGGAFGIPFCELTVSLSLRCNCLCMFNRWTVDASKTIQPACRLLILEIDCEACDCQQGNNHDRKNKLSA